MSNYSKQLSVAKYLGYSTPGKAIISLGKKEFLGLVETTSKENIKKQFDKTHEESIVKKVRNIKPQSNEVTIHTMSTELSDVIIKMQLQVNEIAKKIYPAMCMCIPKEFCD